MYLGFNDCGWCRQHHEAAAGGVRCQAGGAHHEARGDDNQELVGTVVQDMVQRRGNVLGTAGMSEVMHINLSSLTTHLLTACRTVW